MSELLYSGHSGSHPVLVTDEDGLRCLRFDKDERQSCLDLSCPWVLQLAYTRWMMTALLLPPSRKRILVLGLGGGAFVHFLLRHHPKAHLDVVEKAGLVIKLARRYFALPEAPTLHLHHCDAAAFLQETDAFGYDVALLDIFAPGSMAAPVFDPTFHRAILNRLDTDGVLAVNLWSGDKARYHQAVTALQEASNGQMLHMQVNRSSNVIVLAFPGSVPRPAIKRAQRNSSVHQKHYQLDFPHYLKRLRRTNRFPFLAGLLS
ncbi:MAG: hypothetical protein RBT36_02565 [Desulfobulbus sp.]|jgi:spermidine synthase|nr:hypothetical protein [Desulfobulbus sp.]